MQAVLYLASPLPPKQPPSLWQVAKPSVKIVNQFLFGRGMWNQAWRLWDKKFTKLVFAFKILLSFVYVSIGSLSSFNSGLLISQIVNEWVRERERERERAGSQSSHLVPPPTLAMYMQVHAKTTESLMYPNQNNWGPFSHWLLLHNFVSLSNITFWLKLWIF